MSKCDIIKGIKNISVHIVRTANRDFLRFRARRTCNKLMCHQNISIVMIDTQL